MGEEEQQQQRQKSNWSDFKKAEKCHQLNQVSMQSNPLFNPITIFNSQFPISPSSASDNSIIESEYNCSDESSTDRNNYEKVKHNANQSCDQNKHVIQSSNRRGEIVRDFKGKVLEQKDDMNNSIGQIDKW